MCAASPGSMDKLWLPSSAPLLLEMNLPSFATASAKKSWKLSHSELQGVSILNDGAVFIPSEMFNNGGDLKSFSCDSNWYFILNQIVKTFTKPVGIADYIGQVYGG